MRIQPIPSLKIDKRISTTYIGTDEDFESDKGQWSLEISQYHITYTYDTYSEIPYALEGEEVALSIILDDFKSKILQFHNNHWYSATFWFTGRKYEGQRLYYFKLGQGKDGIFVVERNAMIAIWHRICEKR